MPELLSRVSQSDYSKAQLGIPHANKVLHHELEDSFRGRGHVYFSVSISEVRLRIWSCSEDNRYWLVADLLHDVREGCSVIKMKATRIISTIN